MELLDADIGCLAESLCLNWCSLPRWGHLESPTASLPSLPLRYNGHTSPLYLVSAPVFLFRAGVRGCGQREGQGLNLRDVEESCGATERRGHGGRP